MRTMRIIVAAISMATLVACTTDSSDGGGADDTAEVIEVDDCTVGCDAPAAALVLINEIESSDGTGADWIELVNADATPVDLSGWIFGDDADAYTIPSGTTLAPGAYYLLDEDALGFDLDDADAARLIDARGTAIDDYAWTAPAAMTTYGRCGDGAFATTRTPTKGAANLCGAMPPPQLGPWPADGDVIDVDVAGTFSTNMSDLFYERVGDGDVMWAVKNGAGKLYRLVPNGALWVKDTGDWSNGRGLRFPDGGGDVDAEGVTRTELSSTAIYVASERDNNVPLTSRLSVLRYDVTASGTTLTATHEWDLTDDLPSVGANGGFEALTWVPDSFLVARGFYDESAGHAYVPAEYPDHGTGLFFTGLESNGKVYVYALDHVGGGFTRIATFASGHIRIMGLAFDRDVGYLWAQCDNGCDNKMGILTIEAGRFTLRDQFEPPASMTHLNNEGIGFAPESQCVDGFRKFFWADDGASGGHAFHADAIPCGAFLGE